MWCSNDMLNKDMFRAEFVMFVSLKVPSGRDQKSVVRWKNMAWNAPENMKVARACCSCATKVNLQRCQVEENFLLMFLLAPSFKDHDDDVVNIQYGEVWCTTRRDF